MPEAARQSEIDPYRTVEQLHQLTGRSRRLIAQRLAGVPFQPGPRNGRRYHAPVALPLIMADGSREALTKARALLAYHQANLAELKRDRLAAELVPASEVRATWQDILEQTTDRLRRLPAKAAKAVRGLRDLTSVEHALATAVHAALHDLGDIRPGARG